MAAVSDYLENALLNHVFRGDQTGTGLAQPATVYLALYTSDPTDANTGTEVSGGSYARQATAFDAPSSGSITNTVDEDFTDMPAVTVTHVGLLDAATAGNLLWHGALTSSKSVNTGDTFTVKAGNLTISLD